MRIRGWSSTRSADCADGHVRPRHVYVRRHHDVVGACDHRFVLGAFPYLHRCVTGIHLHDDDVGLCWAGARKSLIALGLFGQ